MKFMTRLFGCAMYVLFVLLSFPAVAGICLCAAIGEKYSLRKGM